MVEISVWVLVGMVNDRGERLFRFCLWMVVLMCLSGVSVWYRVNIVVKIVSVFMVMIIISVLLFRFCVKDKCVLLVCVSMIMV